MNNSETTQKAGDALGLWEPKRTLTLESARKHSARIRTLRLLLIGLSLALLAALVWQFVNQPTATLNLDDDPTESVRMVNPRYTGRTDDGLPYALTAEQAVRRTADDKRVELVKPVLHFYRVAGANESTIVAESGLYDDVDKVLELETSVDLKTDDGTRCLSTHARIHARTKIVRGDKPINCTGTFGTVNGKAYEITDNYSVFKFTNGMDAVLEQQSDKRNETEAPEQ